MTKAEYIERLQAVGTETDEAARRELIAALIEDGGADYDSFANTAAELDVAHTANEELREANMRLFRRVGVEETSATKTSEPGKEKRKFEDLFNDKGGLK